MTQLIDNAHSFFNGMHDSYVYNMYAFAGFFLGNVIYYNWLPNYRWQYKYIITPSMASTLYIAYHFHHSTIPESTNNFFYLFGATIPTLYACRSVWLIHNFQK